MGASETLRNCVDVCLDSLELKRNFDLDRGVFTYNVDCSLKNVRALRFRIAVDENLILVLCTMPLNVDVDDPDVLKEMTEFICRVNYRLTFGNFNIDVNDGEIQFQMAIDCHGVDEPSQEVIRRALLMPHAMFEQYGTAILDIMFGRDDAKHAFEQVAHKK